MNVRKGPAALAGQVSQDPELSSKQPLAAELGPGRSLGGRRSSTTPPKGQADPVLPKREEDTPFLGVLTQPWPARLDERE